MKHLLCYTLQVQRQQDRAHPHCPHPIQEEYTAEWDFEGKPRAGTLAILLWLMALEDVETAHFS